MRKRAGDIATQRGSASLTLVLAVSLVLTVTGGAVTAVGDLALTAARARTAADAAALAAAATSPLVAPERPADPRRAAEEVAQANGGRIIGVDGDGWPLRYAVTVEVTPRTRWVRHLAGTVQAGASAAVRPAMTLGVAGDVTGLPGRRADDDISP